ncbi:YchJ family protein [Auraticoccus monumenti]|uniref:SEC-C motif-containing protein n=1 Tax=Auraticoccus monumenti TaxID=675864 RepID=A0A1G6T2N3_9ACTN|nr:YchJ family metal-binding protein [Auraticoccus monumenti]SDD22796.1 SEC-C motif-containing protein [Auraticoccus monumenti]
MTGGGPGACPCGGGRDATRCCAPLLAGRPAPTAERLMRSRYTAHVLGDLDHLLASWHPSTRPRTLTLQPDLTWTGLTVLTTQRSGLLDDDGVVEFRATWVQGEPGVLHEVSRFVREGRNWFYVDGLTP